MSKNLIELHSFYDDKNIKGFFGEYRFLCNFHICRIEYEGLVYSSTEAAYQAQKTLSKLLRDEFTYYTPSEAKAVGQKVNLRTDWEQVKDQIMYDVCLYKFSEHADLKKLLLATGDKHLEEANWWKDKYWGTVNGEGRNQLGITLMQIRDLIKN